jgi:hypothetical protein
MVRTLHPPRRFSRCLHGWKQESNQNADDGNNNQKFNQRKTAQIAPPPLI